MLMYSVYFCRCTCHQSSCSSSSNLITQILLASEAIEISRLPAYAYFIIHITLNFKNDETVSALQYIASDQVILKWRQSWLEQSCQHLNKFWFSMLIGRGRGKGIIDDNWAKSFDHICNLGVNFSGSVEVTSRWLPKKWFWPQKLNLPWKEIQQLRRSLRLR